MELIKDLNIKRKCTPNPFGLHEQIFNMCFNRIKPKSKVYAWVFNCDYYCGSSPSTWVFYAKLCQKQSQSFNVCDMGNPKTMDNFQN